jgi:hypothetical protein
MTQIELNDTEWKPISTAGQSLIAWLDEDNDGETGGVDDVRFVRSTSAPIDGEFTKSKRIYRPTFAKNNDIAKLDVESDSDIFYARCRKGTAIISVLMVRNENEQKLDRLLREGKLFFLSTVLPAQATPVILVWKTGAKPLNFISSVDATLKTTIEFKRAVTIVNPGTEGPVLNRNQNFPDNGLLFKRYLGATFSGGTIFSTQQVGSSSAPGQQSQSKASETTAVLKINTNYGITITPSAACDINLSVLWYED